MARLLYQSGFLGQPVSETMAKADGPVVITGSILLILSKVAYFPLPSEKRRNSGKEENALRENRLPIPLTEKRLRFQAQ